MSWRWPSQNTFGTWTVLYWTRSSRTQFGGPINIWRLAGDTLNITCNFLYCNHQVHRDLLITLYNIYTIIKMHAMNIKLKITSVTLGIIGFLHFLNSLLSQQHRVSASRSVSVFRWKVEESPSELDPLGRAVFFSNTRLLLPGLTQHVAYKSLSFEEQKVQHSEIWRGAVGRTISRSFEESGSRTAWPWSWHCDHSKRRWLLTRRHNVTFQNNRDFGQHRCEVKFYSYQLMHFLIQPCISLLSYIKIT